MNYRIGEVAKIIGTSKEAIRYFEKMNCISEPARNASGYREYDPLQMGVLRWFRLYRGYGYTMSESAQLINAGDMEDVRPVFDGGLERLREKIRCLQKCEADLESFISAIYAEDRTQQPFRLETSPGLYRISFEYKNQLRIAGKQGETYRQWTERMPLVKYTPLFHREDLERGLLEMDSGLGVFEEDVLGWDPAASSHVEYHPPRLCVTGLVVSPPLEYSSLQGIWDFMEDRGLALAGDAFSRPAAFHKSDGIPYFTCKFYVPVREK